MAATNSPMRSTCDPESPRSCSSCGGVVSDGPPSSGADDGAGCSCGTAERRAPEPTVQQQIDRLYAKLKSLRR
jgi:hypothetical protein